MWLDPVRGRADCGNPSRRRDLLSARPQALARRDCPHRHDAHRNPGGARWYRRQLDGAGDGRAISGGADRMRKLWVGVALTQLCGPALHAQVVHQKDVPAAPAPAENFTGGVTLKPLAKATPPGQASVGLVTFARGARSHWHTHPAGQTLIIESGCGWTQEEGGPVRRMCKGDVVTVAPGVKHWHGATAATPMSHFAITETVDGRNVDWLESVTDAQYQAAGRTAK